ncbi:MAG: GNAT family N-acetyltransferase [Desulfobulbaceae bacterium]|nr:MAG: GNAT family N-acetyltransferase [Desulfobulbaceae bacterium]
MRFREITKADIEPILRVRTSTIENSFSRAELAEIGITKDSLADWLDGTVRGWVCEISGRIEGFIMADGQSAEILVIALSPGYEGKGIGRRLMEKAQSWLYSLGHQWLWLWSNPDQAVRAHGFYRKLGWKPTGEINGNNEKLVLENHSQ